MTWTLADWIGLGVVATLWACMLWACYLLGSYENTGVRGWQRILAGAVLFWDEAVVMFSRWEAKLSKRDKSRRGDE